MKNGLVINEKGDKFWYLNNFYHREDGPAIIHVSGSKWWYQNGKPHRLDGPAIEFVSGSKEWFYHGQYIECSSQEVFERLIKLKAFW